ncbi:hypothetical protein WJX74_002656 [Apatococcus lobatus]|uniref:Chlorophyll a-b binding protein, chloroplastic n=1 Tax=Apatococcus lobatus TaxID=904363 RepID=A0AAW1S2H4_9CHLO
MTTQSLLGSNLLASRSSLAAKPSSRVCRLVVRAQEKKEGGSSSAPQKKEEGGGKVIKAERSGPVLLAPGGLASEQSLSYLDGTLPGDYGFDPLGLSDPEGKGVGFVDPNWLRYAEIINGRWAMLGVAGSFAPEFLASQGIIPQTTDEVTWFKTGVIPPAGTYEGTAFSPTNKGYWLDPYSLFFIEVIAFQFAELRRLQDYRNPGSMGKQPFLGLEGLFEGSGDPAYPGGPFFNFAGFGQDADSLQTLKTQELKNGRLAMLAFFGFGSQAVITHQGPWTNLVDHIADPFNNNILTNFGRIFSQ